MTSRSLRSRRALEETEEATAINVESENSVMSGGEVTKLDLGSVSGEKSRKNWDKSGKKTCPVGFWKF
jgi:hypothetical protein